MKKSGELVHVNELTRARSGLRSAVSGLQKKCKAAMTGGTRLTSVSTVDRGWIWDSDHNVTGRELNKLIGQIQKGLSRANSQRNELWKSIIEVYKTIDSLDLGYLVKIEKAFDQINSNYKRIRENNRAIRRDQEEIGEHRVHIEALIDGHEKALMVLKRFKSRIDKLSIGTFDERMSMMDARIDELYGLVHKKRKVRTSANSAKKLEGVKPSNRQVKTAKKTKRLSAKV